MVGWLRITISNANNRALRRNAVAYGYLCPGFMRGRIEGEPECVRFARRAPDLGCFHGNGMESAAAIDPTGTGLRTHRTRQRGWTDRGAEPSINFTKPLTSTACPWLPEYFASHLPPFAS